MGGPACGLVHQVAIMTAFADVVIVLSAGLDHAGSLGLARWKCRCVVMRCQSFVECGLGKCCGVCCGPLAYAHIHIASEQCSFAVESFDVSCLMCVWDVCANRLAAQMYNSSIRELGHKGKFHSLMNFSLCTVWL